MSNQKPRTIDEQIRLLRSRGMAFGNEEEAKQCLAHISYFRLKYYWTDMRDEDTEHDFKEGASFDDVISQYNFDRSLRLILFDAIEIIEVALRAKIINHLSQAKDSGLWYLDASLFERKDYYEDFVLDLKYEFGRSTEPFAKEYIAEHPNWDSESTSQSVRHFVRLRFPARGKIFLLVHDRRAKASRRSERSLEIREVIDLFLKINDLSDLSPRSCDNWDKRQCIFSPQRKRRESLII